MKKRIGTVPFIVVLCWLALVGCSKKAGEKPLDNAAAPSPRDQIQAMIKKQSNKASTNLSPAQEIDSLLKEYHAATDSDGKSDVVYQLGSLGTREAAETLGQLFQLEQNADVKEDILNALSVIDGQEKLRLDVLKLGVRPNQPDNVRKAAIDGLSDLEDPGALAVLKGLQNDPNEEIREAVKDAIEQSSAPGATQSR